MDGENILVLINSNLPLKGGGGGGPKRRRRSLKARKGRKRRSR